MSLTGRLRTVGALIRHFTHRQRLFFLPLLVVLLVGGLLLALTGGLSYITPFLYTLF